MHITYQFTYKKLFNGEECITIWAPRDCFDGRIAQNSFIANSILTNHIQPLNNAVKEKYHAPRQSRLLFLWAFLSEEFSQMVT
jgi:hypothetical protein